MSDCMIPYDPRLMTAPCKHLQSCIMDALSCAGSVIHSDTNLTMISMSSSITELLLMRTNLICGRHQVSHYIHPIVFPLSQKVDTTSNPVLGEGMNDPALLWPNGDAQFMDRTPSPVLTLMICNSQLL